MEEEFELKQCLINWADMLACSDAWNDESSYFEKRQSGDLSEVIAEVKARMNISESDSQEMISFIESMTLPSQTTPTTETLLKEIHKNVSMYDHYKLYMEERGYF